MTAAGAVVWTALALAVPQSPPSPQCQPPPANGLIVGRDVEPGEWFDPAFLQRLAPGAMRITIGDGEKKVQDIRLGGG